MKCALNEPLSLRSRSCRVIHEQHGGATAELGTDGVEEMADKVAEEGVPLGSNTAGCSFSLTGTDGNFEKTRASIDGAVAKHAEVIDVNVIGLPGSVGVEVKAVAASERCVNLLLLISLAPASRRVSKCGTEMVYLPPSTRVMPFVE
eukprot:3474237-Pleurochrysis_carterae.AAC.1